MLDAIQQLIETCQQDLLDLHEFSLLSFELAELTGLLRNNTRIRRIRFSPFTRAILFVEDNDPNKEDDKEYEESLRQLAQYNSPEPTDIENQLLVHLKSEDLVQLVEDSTDEEYVDKLCSFLGNNEYFEMATLSIFKLYIEGDSKAKYHLSNAFYPCSGYSAALLKNKIQVLKKLYRIYKGTDYIQYVVELCKCAVDYEGGDSGYLPPDYDDYMYEYIRIAYDILMECVKNGNNLHDADQFLSETMLQSWRGDIAGEMPERIYEKLYKNSEPLKKLIAQEKRKNTLLPKDSPRTREYKTHSLVSVMQWEKLFEKGIFSLLFFSNSISISRGAKNPAKICDLSDQKDGQGLSLHTRLSLVERLIDGKTSKLSRSIYHRAWLKYTLVVASFGLIVSDQKHQVNGSHQRKLISVPIVIDDKTIIKEVGQNIHAEEALIKFLNDPENIKRLLMELKRAFSIKGKGHKAYGFVLELHATYDMCFDCFSQMSSFLYKLKHMVFTACVELGFVCSLMTRFLSVIRYTSDVAYYTGAQASDADKRKSVRGFISENPDYQLTNELRDVRNKEEMIIHGNSNWHQLWTNPQSLFRENHRVPEELMLENWTAFASSAYSIPAEPFDYTRLGFVDTSDVNDDVEEITQVLPSSATI